jgi:hypothetical protein
MGANIEIDPESLGRVPDDQWSPKNLPCAKISHMRDFCLSPHKVPTRQKQIGQFALIDFFRGIVLGPKPLRKVSGMNKHCASPLYVVVFAA